MGEMTKKPIRMSISAIPLFHSPFPLLFLSWAVYSRDSCHPNVKGLTLMNRKKAFTLIELLIVVAIIAILAAIAVPNFLEAQVRSKVARVKTDMRSIATAIEAYTVDYNRDPIGWEEGVIQFGLWNWVAGQASNIGPYRLITTPVAYMTSIPVDPFAMFAKGNTGDPNTHFGAYYHYSSDDQAPLSTMYPENKARGLRWTMRSIGPSYVNPGAPSGYIWPPDIMTSKIPNGVYDATNGTKSQGWITRTNKGICWEGLQ